MSTTNDAPENRSGSTASPTNYGRSGPRPTYFLLGVDTEGSHHIRDTLTDSVHVITPDGRREHRQQLRGHPIEAYMTTIRNGRGWATEHYGVGIAGLVERALE